MARPELHARERILDSAQGLVLDRGIRAATVARIAEASGAPVGSLYHRFGSRDDLLAEVWARAARRSQAAILDVIERAEEPSEAIVAGSLALFDFARTHRADAQLLASFRREDLVSSARTPGLATELRNLNRPLEEVVARLAPHAPGRTGAERSERVAFALFDLPLGAVRRHVLAGAAPPPGLRRDIEVAVRAVLRADHGQSQTPTASLGDS